MGNDTLNNLGHQSIDKHPINEETGMPLTFKRDSIVSKQSLWNELNLTDGYDKEAFNNE